MDVAASVHSTSVRSLGLHGRNSIIHFWGAEGQVNGALEVPSNLLLYDSKDVFCGRHLEMIFCLKMVLVSISSSR